MRLKRLTLHGFKTFADKTVIEFAPGVTAIVGPNGSGKSNLLDSLLWCLGEQKASQLRAAKASDVIFAGSARRKPMGMAEVSLTVDNEDGFLPLPFSEVTVTRRVYRSGEGEYLLNKTPCRLKDITDLFLDTGVGRGAYAIVNQSEIDAILSARPEDRRELFEEAAGIKKYRQKKREAQRKLEATEANLLRLHDIAREVETGLAPLEAQSLTARRYNELTTRLREVEVGQLAFDYKRLESELTELRQTEQAALIQVQAFHDEAAGLEHSAKEIGERIAEAEADMDRARLNQQAAMAEGERVAGRIALSGERKAGAVRTLETLTTDLAQLESDQARFETEAKAQGQAAEEAKAKAEEQAAHLGQVEAVAREADRALTELSRTVKGQEADYLELARRLAGQKAQLEALRVRVAGQETEIAEAMRRAETRQSEAQTARTEVQILTQSMSDAKARYAETERIVREEREPGGQNADAEVSRLADEKVKTERRAAEQSARLRVLQETEDAQEGYFAGVKSVSRAYQAGKLSGRYQVVADALRVPAELDTAVEVALGGSLQDIICDTESEAKTAIRLLNETRGGRATFLPLDSLREVDVPDSLRRAARQFSGVLGSGADLVGHDADVSPAVRVLLARVLFVDDLDTATRVSKQIRDWAKIVTLSGEVVVPTGAITGGAQGRPGPNLLGRKREIADLQTQTAKAKTALQALTEREAQAKSAAQAAREALAKARADVQAARDTVRDTERALLTKNSEAERLEREAKALVDRVQSLQASSKGDSERLTALEAALAGSNQDDVGAQSAREAAQDELARLAMRRSEAQTEARTLNAELASSKERARSLARETERARESALRAEITREERTRRADEARTIVSVEDAGQADREREQTQVKTRLSEANALFDKWRERRSSLLTENFQIGERIKASHTSAQMAGEQGAQAKLRAARVETQMESVEERLRAEYELEPEVAIAQTGGDAPARDIATEIARLKREIRALGNVNTGAIEEYERLSERHTFLSTQRADLLSAKEKLTTAIAEIDDSTKGVFHETFKAVEAAFAIQFARLFGGGSTQLLMTNPDDVLETGIEIVAQPPGKKRQNLALLSGGERALTATALLFAFLMVRPAPFCVLDEVDAPLDGANVEKFADLLRDFGATGQFIVITHNATTMEAAPLWYGVTMQEPGVSRGISLKVPEMPASTPDALASAPDALTPGPSPLLSRTARR